MSIDNVHTYSIEVGDLRDSQFPANRSAGPLAVLGTTRLVAAESSVRMVLVLPKCTPRRLNCRSRLNIVLQYFI